MVNVMICDKHFMPITLTLLHSVPVPLCVYVYVFTLLRISKCSKTFGYYSSPAQSLPCCVFSKFPFIHRHLVCSGP